jgi:carboxyl-terminal processing protease
MLTKYFTGNRFYCLFIFFLLNSSIHYCSGQKLSISQQAYDIVKTVEKYHFSPKPVDNNFSETVFEEFIALLDPSGIIFSIEDIKKLEEFKTDIDDEILNKNCVIVEETSLLYQKKLHYIDSLINNLDNFKSDFTLKDSLTFNIDEIYESNENFVRRWENLIKAQILSSCLSNSDSVNIALPPVDSIFAIQNKIISREKCRIKSKLEYEGGPDQYIGSMFLKAVSYSFDPHTEYYTPTEESSFEYIMSKEALSYGFEIFRNEMGEIEVYSIAPGGPAWKSNLMNEGDVILGMKTEQGFTKEFDCIELSEVMQYMSSKEINKADFLVRKKNEKKLRITLQKEKINVEENIVRGFIIEGEYKIGYIYLHSFYTQMEGVNLFSSGCANDIAKEIIKLRNEGISGLVFDIRDNGGGAIMEAVQLSGIFIDFGALCIVQNRGEEPVTIKDLNRGVIFNEPLVILVNSFSASASELFAASMQDYNRAVIVGSRTFGKSTSQNILPSDSYNYDLASLKDKKNKGYLKLTSGQFFRITGKSHQKEGIMPDICLPFIYDHLDIGESAYKTALNPAIINKKTYYTPLDSLPITELKKLSESRVNNDSSFIYIKKLSESLPDKQKYFTIPLNFEEFKTFYNQTDYFLNNDLDKNESEKQLFLIENPEYLKGTSSTNDSLAEVNESIMNQIKTDIYINEAYLIIKDLININKK